MKTLTFGVSAAILALVLVAPVSAQETPNWDAGKFIMKNHLHQIAGFATLGLAAATGAAALAGWQDVHPVLGYATVGSGLVTLALGLTAYSDQLDEIWPHAVLMGLAETGWILNAFVLEPGSLAHKVTGAASLASLGGAIVAIVLIRG